VKKKADPTFSDFLDMECCSSEPRDRLEALGRLIKEDPRFNHFTKEQKDILDLILTIVDEVAVETQEKVNRVCDKISNFRISVSSSPDTY
jgi:hypothetical protein